MRRIIIALALAGILGVPAFGQGLDPLIGSWKLNVEKSISIGAPLSKSQTNVITREGDHFIATVDAVSDQGQAYHVVITLIYDGQPHPVTGWPNYNSTTYTRIGNTQNAVRFKDGKPVEVSQNVIVPGKTLTVTAEGVNANGQQYHYVWVFDRQ
jgi:hypothetical protein